MNYNAYQKYILNLYRSKYCTVKLFNPNYSELCRPIKLFRLENIFYALRVTAAKTRLKWIICVLQKREKCLFRVKCSLFKQ